MRGMAGIIDQLHRSLEDLRRSQSELIATLRTLSDADLNGPVPNRDYDRAHLLHGLVQHHAYHAGQMSLLKRALEHRAKGTTRSL